jgi:hypothetical protein
MQTARYLTLIGFAISLAGRSLTSDPGDVIPPELVLQRFQVNKAGDALLVPVKISGKNRLFLVDTGCTRTAIHLDLLVGKPEKYIMASTLAGHVEIGLYHPPDGLTLGLDLVLGMDLKPQQESWGYPIEGILGMDFLHRYIMNIDFDRGELLFLKSIPKDSGKAVKFRWNALGLPVLEAPLLPEKTLPVMIDTGFGGLYSGALVRSSLRKSQDFQKVGSTLKMTAMGIHRFSLYRGKRISLNGFDIDEPIFAESSTDISVVGLGFLSRFVVTFDFPNQKIYLKNGRDFHRPDLQDLSGMKLIRKNGLVSIHTVDNGSAASSAGLHSNDVLLQIGTRRTEEMSLLDVQKALSQAGSLRCTIIHDSTERTLTLNLSP